MNVKRLDGRLLNYWVAKSAGPALGAPDPNQPNPHGATSGAWAPHRYNPANDWSHAGAIIAQEWFAIEDMLVEWFGNQWSHVPTVVQHPLKWFMRAYVATQFGDEVEELTAPMPLHFECEDSATSTPLPQARDPASSWLGAWFRKFCW